MSMKTGQQYIDGINQAKPCVWLDGKPVKGKISKHTAFRGVMKTQAALYDLQHQEKLKPVMSYESPDTGQPVGMSFLRPKTREDLITRRTMMEIWANVHHGFLGRAPDYMNTAMMSFYSAADVLNEHHPQFAENLKQYYAYCRDHDITLSHVFIQPQISRYGDTLTFLGEEAVTTRILEKTSEGIIVSGAFLLATQGVTADELLVYPSPAPGTNENSPYAFMFAVPNNLKGISFICRQSLVLGDSSFNFPLSSRYEEMDTLVVFDHVLVPWDRVFICGDQIMVFRMFKDSHFHTHVNHQIICKNIAKTEFVLGTIQYLIEVLEIEGHLHVLEKAAEVMLTLESLKSFLIASEVNASLDQWGTMVPDPAPLTAASNLFPKVFPRMLEIVQLLGASGIIMIPSENDYSSPVSADLSKYLRGLGSAAKENTALFRLAWELSASSFGGREALYERFFFGNTFTVTNRFYQSYGYKEICLQKVKNFLNQRKKNTDET